MKVITAEILNYLSKKTFHASNFLFFRFFLVWNSSKWSKRIYEIRFLSYKIIKRLLSWLLYILTLIDLWAFFNLILFENRIKVTWRIFFERLVFIHWNILLFDKSWKITAWFRNCICCWEYWETGSRKHTVFVIVFVWNSLLTFWFIFFSQIFILDFQIIIFPFDISLFLL